MVYSLGEHKVEVPDWLNKSDMEIIDSHMSAIILSLEDIRSLKAEIMESRNAVYTYCLEQEMERKMSLGYSHLLSIQDVVTLASQKYGPKEQEENV